MSKDKDTRISRRDVLQKGGVTGALVVGGMAMTGSAAAQETCCTNWQNYTNRAYVTFLEELPPINTTIAMVQPNGTLDFPEHGECESIPYRSYIASQVGSNCDYSFNDEYRIHVHPSEPALQTLADNPDQPSLIQISSANTDTQCPTAPWVARVDLMLCTNSSGGGDEPDPETQEDCKNGGWEDYGFRNQGQCIRYVNTGEDSRE